MRLHGAQEGKARSLDIFCLEGSYLQQQGVLPKDMFIRITAVSEILKKELEEN